MMRMHEADTPPAPLSRPTPPPLQVMKGYLPTAAIITNAKMLYLATGG